MTEGSSCPQQELLKRLRDLQESAAEKDTLIDADYLRIQELQSRVRLLQQGKSSVVMRHKRYLCTTWIPRPGGARK
ncbi:hypothetical protein MRX96_018325 [Rhipicephalus microplus]